ETHGRERHARPHRHRRRGRACGRVLRRTTGRLRLGTGAARRWRRAVLAGLAMAGRTDQPRVDFAGGAVGYRFRRGGERGHPLVRAAGIKKGGLPSIVDATAGLGRDAFLLASAGATVILIERSAEVHALLKEALARAAAESPELAEVVARMTLVHGDASHPLPGLKPH